MNNVRELRIKKGIQQKELAIEIGVANATVSDWEHGRKNPSGERLRKLADFFGVSPTVVLGNEEIEPTKKVAFIPADPKVVGVSETEQIVQFVLKNIDNDKTPEIKIVSGMMEKMSKDQQEQVVAVVRAMFANHPEVLNA